MKSEILNDAIAITIDMRNSSNLISNERDLDRAENVIIGFNKTIKENCGKIMYDQSTGDGFLLIYDATIFLEQYETINNLVVEVKSYILDIASKYPECNLGYGIGMQKSKLKIIETSISNCNILFMVGQCVNTSVKYANLHNRQTLGHNNFNFDGILTTKSVSDYLEGQGFKSGDKLPQSSGILAYKLVGITKGGY